MDIDQHAFNKEDAYRTLERVNFWINNCDSKSSFILAFTEYLRLYF